MLDLLTTGRAADQAFAWLLTYALHSTLLLAVAWGVSRRLGGRSLRLQETIWRCALVGALATASAQVALGRLGHGPVAGRWTLASASAPASSSAPGLEGGRVGAGGLGRPATAGAGRARMMLVLERLPAGHAAAAARGAAPAGGSSAPAVALSAAAGRPSVAAAPRRAGLATARLSASATSAVAGANPVGAGSPAGWSALRGALPLAPPLARLLLAAWLLGALAVTLGHVRTYLALRRRLLYRPEVVGGGVVARLAELVRGSGFTRRVRLTCTWRLRVPVALGSRGPEVCVPPRALFELSDEQQDALLAHELAHLARRDPLWLPITQLLVSVFFFQPLNWLARRRLRELSELLCDSWAVAHTGRPLSLAGCLAEVAGWSAGALATHGGRRADARLPVPGMAGRPSQLAQRIRRLLDGTPLEGHRPDRRGVAVLLAMVLLAVALAAPGVSAGSSAALPAAASSAVSMAAVSAGSHAEQLLPPALPPVLAAPAEPGRAARALMVLAALAPVDAAEERAGAAAAVPPGAAGASRSPAPAGAPGMPADAANTGRSDSAPSAGAPRGGHAAAPAASPDLDAERERLAAAAERLAQLDKLSTLSKEQVAAIAAAVGHLSHTLDGRLKEQLERLDRQLQAARVVLPRLSGPPRVDLAELENQLTGLHPSAKEMADLDAELQELAAEHPHPSAAQMADLDAQMRKLSAEHPLPSAKQMADLDAELKSLGAGPLHLSAEELDHLREESRRALEHMPKLGLDQAEIDRLRADMKRTFEESAGAAPHALTAAEREKIVADAHRLAEQLRPDRAQLEALRGLLREHEQLSRLLAEQRAEIEAMRREIQQQTEALRDQARRLSETRRLHPRPKARPDDRSRRPAPPAPATPAAPAAPAAPAPPQAAPPAAAPAAPPAAARPATPATPAAPPEDSTAPPPPAGSCP